MNNNYFKFDKYGPSSEIYKNYYIDHEDKYLPHIEFTDKCKAILELTVARYRYVPKEAIEATLFDRGYTELFEEEDK